MLSGADRRMPACRRTGATGLVLGLVLGLVTAMVAALGVVTAAPASARTAMPSRTAAPAAAQLVTTATTTPAATTTTTTTTTAATTTSTTATTSNVPAVSLVGGLTQVSSDPYAGDGAQHATEVEPDVVAHGSTLVSAFQVGRFNSGGSASNIGWASSADGGATWQHGLLAGVSTAGGGSYPRAVNQSVAYDAAHGTWLISSLGVAQSGSSYIETELFVSRSADATTWSAPVTVAATGHPDKDWIGCDDTASSPHYGRCYAAWSVTDTSYVVVVAHSDDGGLTWSAPVASTSSVQGYDVQPVVLPNGTLVIVSTSQNPTGRIYAYVSTDGGATLANPVTVSTYSVHSPSGIRAFGKPTTALGGDGRLYAAWQACSLAPSCGSNDIVMSSTTDGTHWSAVARVTDAYAAGTDDMIPGLGADPATSGQGTHLGLIYWKAPYACGTTGMQACTLTAQFVGSPDAGATWSDPIDLGPTSPLTDLPVSYRGAMVGDYFHVGFAGGNAVTTFPVAATKTGTTGFHQAMTSATVSLGTASAPGAPTGVTASASGGQVNVSWTPPASTGGSHITSYVVTPSGGAAAQTVSGTTTTATFGSLPAGSYTFTVAAVNAAGTGPASAPSNSVSVASSATVPSAPTGAVAELTCGTVTVSWVAPSSDGGSAITSYVVTPSSGAPQTVTGTTATFSGLAAGTYTFTVAAVNAVGTGPASAPSNAVTVTTSSASAPSAPQSVTATLSGSTVTVTWSAPASDGGAAVTSYTVTPSKGSPVTVTGTSATFGNLAAGSYTFAVTATNSAGTSPAAANNTITITSAPAAPANVTATASNGSVVVSWTAPSDGGSPITSYVVTPSSGAAQTVSGCDTTAAFTGLAAGTYTFTVAAVNSVGTGPAATSNAVTVGTTATVPSAPTGVTASVTGTDVTVTWAAPSSDGGAAIASYTVTPSTGSPMTVTGTTATFTSVAAGTYTYTVAATNSVGTGPASAPSNAVTVAPAAGVPDAPTGVSGSPVARGAVVTWTAPASDGGSAITGYVVTASPGGATASAAASATSARVGGLSPATAYTFTVTATNANGSGPASSASAAVTPKRPATVGDFTGSGTTTLDFVQPSTAHWYMIHVTNNTYGASGDVFVPADYSGSGKWEEAVYRPSTGDWIFRSKAATVNLGTPAAGDVPVPGDYDGDGRDEPAIWRPSTGQWFVSGLPTVVLGQSGDIPVPGDYDGDGIVERAVFRPSTGQWFIGTAAPVVYGQAGDMPAPGDYNGDGSTDLAVWRGSTRQWLVSGAAPVTMGANGDLPAQGDYDGNGTVDPVVWRPSTGHWFSATKDLGGWGSFVAGDMVPLATTVAVREVGFGFTH